jgi:predicted regulator of Ras-like GTPase activity (Roadblock/LC7/MglB family)
VGAPVEESRLKGHRRYMQDSVSIFEDDYWAINQQLKYLLRATGALIVLLIDKAGQVITSAGDLSRLDVSSFASLQAADVAATSQLATLIGEKEFSSLFHQGRRESIYVSLLNPNIILVVIFDEQATLGLVRIRVKTVSDQITKIFERIFAKLERRTVSAPAFDEEFALEAEAEIDNLFK